MRRGSACVEPRWDVLKIKPSFNSLRLHAMLLWSSSWDIFPKKTKKKASNFLENSKQIAISLLLGFGLTCVVVPDTEVSCHRTTSTFGQISFAPKIKRCDWAANLKHVKFVWHYKGRWKVPVGTALYECFLTTRSKSGTLPFLGILLPGLKLGAEPFRGIPPVRFGKGVATLPDRPITGTTLGGLLATASICLILEGEIE